MARCGALPQPFYRTIELPVPGFTIVMASLLCPRGSVLLPPINSATDPWVTLSVTSLRPLEVIMEQGTPAYLIRVGLLTLFNWKCVPSNWRIDLLNPVLLSRFRLMSPMTVPHEDL